MLNYDSPVQKEQLPAQPRSVSKFADTECASTAVSKDPKTALSSETSSQDSVSVKNDDDGGAD